MYQARTKRQELMRRLLTYTVVPVIITAGVALLVMYTIGYRYNSSDHRLEQGGLVQFITQPTGARVEVDGMKLPGRTNTRLDATAGSHTVLITRPEYHTWQKTVTVEPGKLLWLNYIRMIPKDLQIASVLSLPRVDMSLTSYENDQLILLEDSMKPELSVVELSAQRAAPRKVVIDPALFADEQTEHVFLLNSLDTSGRYAMVEVVNKTKQWLLIDMINPERSQNISKIVGDDISKVMFMPNDTRKLYVITKDVLRQVNLDEQTTSAPLISNIRDISISHKGVIAYVTSRDALTSKRLVGYYTAGASAPHVLRQIFDDGSQAMDFAVGEYNDGRYGALRVGDTLELFSFPTEASDASQEGPTKSLSTIALAEGSDFLSVSPSGRFILSQKSSTFTTYDLELKKVTSATLKGDTTASRQLRWLDDYHVWSDRGDKLYVYEFDGENAHVIDSVRSGNTVLLSKNGKQLWYLDNVEDKPVIKRAQLSS